MKKTVFFGVALGMLWLSACSPKPIAKFQVNPTEKITAPAEISISNDSENATTYLWDFGDGTTSTDPAPKHTYAESGQYQITLKATKGKKTTNHSQTIMIEQPEHCLVLLETEYGNMTIKLSDATPKHRDNFIKLVEKGYFNDLLFHRVINGFMIQGGDPDSKNAKAGVPLGMGGPGYTIPAEFVDSLIHLKGALAAARQGDQVNPLRASSGSQFYIVQGSPMSDAQLGQIERQLGFSYTPEQREQYKTVGGTPFLDRQYTVFGHIVEGLDVIDRIGSVATDERDRPKKDIKIKATVIR
jgi:cyclophilin family peptidyl-prolyl cis-trans isomerase